MTTRTIYFGQKPRPVACMVNGCGKTFADEVDMRKHVRMKHLPEGWKTCPVCERRCKGERGLTQHRKDTGH